MSFQNLNIIDPLSRAVAKEGYTIPTPIQVQAIPHLLEGKDLMGIAQTGTGKTAAFVLPILQKMAEEFKAPIPGAPRVLVLAPTRELVAQIDESFATYGQYLRFKHMAIFGGVSQVPQVKLLSKGIDILVATPGRLLDLMNQGYIKLRSVEYFVLDEMDRMLDMGFIKDMRKILSALPQKHQSLFFSATSSPQTGEFAKTFLANPVHIEVAPLASTANQTTQHVFFVDQDKKYKLLQELLKQQHLRRVLVFTRTKRRADKVAFMLSRNKIKADSIHGNKSQTQRTRAVDNFKSGRIQALIATDIAARGIDIDDISHVINYDLPKEPESYVHRIGRTGRAGAEGIAYSFCSADERGLLCDIERLTKREIETMEHKYHSEQARNAPRSAAGSALKRSKFPLKSLGQKSIGKPSPRKPYHASHR